jgi:hypothetical protein
MANNYGLMLAAGGAALIGFVFLSMGKDEAAEASGLELSMEDLDIEYCPDDMSPDGTVFSVNGIRVIPRCPTIASFKIQECDYVNYLDDGTPICGKFGGSVHVPFPKDTDPPDQKWYGILTDWIEGSPKRNEILDRAETPEDSKLYMFSGEPVIESIGITKPAWLAEQDPDPIQ